MNIAVIKQATTIVVGFGTSRIIKGIIQNNVPIVTTADQVGVTVASVVIGSMAADALQEYTDAKIDAIAGWYNEHFQKSS
jgi:uncharacterized SAM-dependent methyltransferase